MNEQLHPLTLAEILDRTAHLYRSRFFVFVGIGLIPAGTLFVFAGGAFAFLAWMGVNSRNGAAVADALVWIFLILLLVLAIPISLTASALGEAAMTDAAARLFLGEKITIRSSFKTAWKRGWRYVGLYTLQMLAIMAAPVIVFSVVLGVMIASKVAGLAANDNSPLFGGLVILLIVVLGVFAIWMLLRLCLAFPACVVEQATAWNSLKRGTLMSRGTRARIFLLYVLGMMLNQILAWCVMFPVLIAMAFIPGLQGQAYAQTVGTIATFVIYGSYFAVRALTKPIYGIALTLFYFDQRIRKEGFDIEWMMQQAGMVAVPSPEPSPPVPLPPAQPEERVEVSAPMAEIPAVAEPVALAEPGVAATTEEGTA